MKNASLSIAFKIVFFLLVSHLFSTICHYVFGEISFRNETCRHTELHIVSNMLQLVSVYTTEIQYD